MSSVRAFLAITLPGQLKASIIAMQRDLQVQIPDARWTRPENLHLTLQFFRQISQETLEKIKVSVLSVKRCQQPFTVEVKGLGVFPNQQRPRILWLDLEPKDQLRQLHRDCRERLRQAGVTTESRLYSPHLTIGRLQRHKSGLTGLFNSVGHTRIGLLPVDKLVLFESRLHPDGAEHIPLLKVNLDDDIRNL